MISFALAVVMLLSTAVIPINAESEIQYTEADLHEMITYADAVAAGHVNRLNDEEDMNTLIFANRDNTKTMYYYGENIKYTDENGTVRDKTNKLTYSNGVYVNEDNDINVAIPTSLSSGVTLTYEDVEITMTPEFVGAGSLTSTAPTATLTSTSRGQADNVTYDSVFGSGISVRYTPMYSGIKEDIILSSYTGTYSFDFTIDTNGLLMLPDTALAEAEEETELDDSLNADDNATLVTPPNWYFATREDPTTPVAWLSEIYIYDSAGNTALGSVSVEQTAASEYAVTVIADKAFLEAETTVYPVTVDPSINFNIYTATIDDATLSKTAPTTNYGSTSTLNVSLNHCSVIRFLGLNSNAILNSLDVTQVKSAYLYLYCTSVNGSATIYANQYSPTRTSSAWWTESGITCAANGVGYDSSPQYSRTISSTGSVGINMLKIVRGWMEDSSLCEKGAILRMSSSASTSNAFSFNSSEYVSGSSTPNYQPYLTISYNYSGIYEISNDGSKMGLENNYANENYQIQCAPDISDVNDAYGADNDVANLFRITYISSSNSYKIASLANRNGYVTYINVNNNKLILLDDSYSTFVLNYTSDGYVIQLSGNTTTAVTKGTDERQSVSLTAYSGTPTSNQLWDLTWSDKNDEYAYYASLNFASPFPTKTATITSRYSVRTLSGDLDNHHGLDLVTGDDNEPIYSVSSGTVIANAYHESMGNYVVVDTGIPAYNDTTKTIYVIYEHLKTSSSLTVGHSITKGTYIADMGKTGATTHHLHLGIYNSNANLNLSGISELSYYRSIDPLAFYAEGTFEY